MDHKAGNQLPHGWMMGFSTVQVEYFLGSADWMPRNLVSRIEVMTPVYDEDLKRDLLRTVEYGLKDTTNGRIVDGHGGNELQQGPRFRSQEELYKAYVEDEKQSPIL